LEHAFTLFRCLFAFFLYDCSSVPYLYMLNPGSKLYPYTYKATCMYTGFPKNLYTYWVWFFGGKPHRMYTEWIYICPVCILCKNQKPYTYSVDFSVLFLPVYIQGGFHIPLTTQYAFSAPLKKNDVFYAYFTKQYPAFEDFIARQVQYCTVPYCNGTVGSSASGICWHICRKRSARRLRRRKRICTLS
jgi:hypothetical protein